ncbi:META domain-containing protein [Algoriphagus sp. oki45]|uniref:META domain-containing protein n=1 Tax=Algoriphagus sp. oki45 TaxID=3067294 RepID=UPI0027F93EDF|nr:META domain-containing protein [Algoriphagus sp. oki45]
MKSIRIFILAILILSFGGCSSSSSLNPLSLLTGNSWALNTLLGQGLDLSKFSQGIPSLSFLEGGRLAGFAGCNNFSGGFSLEGTGLQLDPGAMTKKTCPGTGEDEFMAALSQVKNFKVGKDQLTLLDGAKELMSFVPKED